MVKSKTEFQVAAHSRRNSTQYLAYCQVRIIILLQPWIEGLSNLNIETLLCDLNFLENVYNVSSVKLNRLN